MRDRKTEEWRDKNIEGGKARYREIEGGREKQRKK